MTVVGHRIFRTEYIQLYCETYAYNLLPNKAIRRLRRDSCGMKDCRTFTGVHALDEVNNLTSCAKAKKIQGVNVMNAYKKTQSSLLSQFLLYFTSGRPLSVPGTRAVNKQPSISALFLSFNS